MPERGEQLPKEAGGPAVGIVLSGERVGRGDGHGDAWGSDGRCWSILILLGDGRRWLLRSGGRLGRAKEERGCKDWGDWAREGRGGMQALHRKGLVGGQLFCLGPPRLLLLESLAQSEASTEHESGVLGALGSSCA